MYIVISHYSYVYAYMHVLQLYMYMYVLIHHSMQICIYVAMQILDIPFHSLPLFFLHKTAQMAIPVIPLWNSLSFSSSSLGSYG